MWLWLKWAFQISAGQAAAFADEYHWKKRHGPRENKTYDDKYKLGRSD